MSHKIFRFAPSPNGYLHLGHAYSALLNARMANACGGTLLLRIEDVDRSRCRPWFETAIYEDLAWLEIGWGQSVRRQSEHLAAYAEALTRLTARGLLYPTFDSRADIAQRVAALEQGGRSWPRDPDGAPLYPGSAQELSEGERARQMAAGEPFALRLDMAAALAQAPSLTWNETGSGPDSERGNPTANPAAWGDVILARKEIPTSYHLSVVVDDAIQGITDIVRGQDLFHATSVHRLLQHLLGLPTPRYHHHPLILDADGRKLSKSTQATALRTLRAEGLTPSDIRRRLGFD